MRSDRQTSRQTDRHRQTSRQTETDRQRQRQRYARAPRVYPPLWWMSFAGVGGGGYLPCGEEPRGGLGGLYPPLSVVATGAAGVTPVHPPPDHHHHHKRGVNPPQASVQYMK